MRTWTGFMTAFFVAGTVSAKPTPLPPRAEFPDALEAAPDSAPHPAPGASQPQDTVPASHTPPVIWTEPALPYDDDVVVDDEPVDEPWYGGSTLFVDALSLGTFSLGVETESVEIVFAGMIGYLAGGPIVHGVHGRGTTAMASLTLRVAAPSVGGWLLYNASGGEDNERRATEGAVAGVLLGVGIAIALDAAVLARKPIEPPAKDPGSTQKIERAPTMSITQDTVTGGVAGLF